jgi:hypothetical protein
MFSPQLPNTQTRVCRATNNFPMSTKALNQSKDYSLFSSHEHQQPMSERHVARIAESMDKNGFLQSKPISVVRRAGKFVIVDGHHRFAAARELGIAVFYVIEAEEVSELIGEVNQFVRVWKSIAFAKMHAARRDPHYVELLSYVEKGIPLKQASSILRGQSGHSGNATTSIRAGTFTVKTRTSADVIVSFIEEFKASSPAVASALFIEALSSLLFVEQFDSETLKQRLRANPLSLVKCNNREQMIAQIEEIYNFRSREKVPLKFLAGEIMKQRKEVGELNRKRSSTAA